MYNLLKNAVTYSEYGNITLFVDAGKTNVNIAVSDEGVGVPEDEKSEIFEPFFEGSRTKTSAKGKGLGLSVAQKIIFLHNSVITVKDNKNGGAIFSFSLLYKFTNKRKTI